MFLKKRFKTFYDKFINLKGEPKAIAAGVAIGVFVGVTPTIPFHTAMIVLIGLLFRKNITAAYLGAWLVSNPLTVAPLYLSQYELGRILLGMERSHFTLADDSLSAIAALGWQILLPLLMGGLIMAPIFAFLAYFLAHRLIVNIRARGQK
jgi:uncharacterized protein